MRRFFDREDTQWRNLTGALHLYVELKHDRKLVRSSLSSTECLKDFSALAIQPIEYLHTTVQRLDLYRHELSETDWEDLCDNLRSRYSRLPQFPIMFSKPRVSQEAIESIGTETNQWKALLRETKNSFLDCDLEEALTEPPFAPHYTLAYCVKNTDPTYDSKVCQRLEKYSTETSIVVSKIVLVAVDQSPTEGVFRFRRIIDFPLTVS